DPGSGVQDDPRNTGELGDDIQGCYHFNMNGEAWEQDMDCIVRLDGYSQFFDDYNRSAQARSRHAGGVNTCFGDGSVRFVRNEVKERIWRAMLTRDGDPGYETTPYSYDF